MADYTQRLNAMKQTATTTKPSYENLSEDSEHEGDWRTWGSSHTTYGETENKNTNDEAL